MRIANSQTNGTGSDLMAEHRKEGRDPKDMFLSESRCSLGP